MKHIKLYEDFANESAKVGSHAIKIGSILKFRDGETWKVTKFIGSPSNPRGVFALPHGETKDSYVAVALEFKMEELEKTVESVTESIVNEAKQLNRDEFMALLDQKYGFNFVRTTEEFDGSNGGVWVSGENSESLGGKRIYNYYGGTGAAYELGVLKRFETAINKLGWYSEWYDPGTVMIWPTN